MVICLFMSMVLGAYGNNDFGPGKPLVCYYCKKQGHFRAHSPKLNVKSVANSMIVPADDVSQVSGQCCVNHQDLFLPSRFSGTERSAASLSILKKSALPVG